MPQSPTNISSSILERAKGINDAYGQLKLPDGAVPFSINMFAAGDVWNRRAGRDFSFYKNGMVLDMFQFDFGDGDIREIGTIGSRTYDFDTAIPSPDTISGLKLWLKPETLTSYIDGQAVSSWTDSSGSGNTALQADTSKQPFLRMNAFNGRSVVRFDGTKAIPFYLQIADNAGLDFTRITAFAAIIDNGTGANGQRTIFCKNPSVSSGSPAYVLWRETGGGNVNKMDLNLTIGGVNSDHFSTSTLTTGTAAVVDAYYDGTNVYHDRNGSADGSSAQAGNIDATTGSLQIGGFTAAFSDSGLFDGDIAEILLYNVALSATDRANVQAYLMDKYFSV